MAGAVRVRIVLWMAAIAVFFSWGAVGDEPKTEPVPAAAPVGVSGAATAPKDLKNPVAYTRASADRGKALYFRHCRQCHDFDAKGRAGVDFVNTPLPDLTNPSSYKHGTSEGEMFAVVRDGTKTDMESFKTKLNEEEIWSVVNYLQSLRPKPRPFVEPTPEAAKPDAAKKEEAPVDPKTLKNPVAYSAGSVAQGKNLYLRNCRACHDFDGKGRAGIDFVPTPLPDLTDPKTWKHGVTDGEMFTVIRDGTKTDMESFKKKLSDEQMWHLVNYVRSLGPKNVKPGAVTKEEKKD